MDGAVRLLSRHDLGWARGLANAVLRRVAARDVPPPRDVEDYLTLWESHPRWLVRRWVRELGEEGALRRCRANNREAPVVLRANTRVASREVLMAQLKREGLATRAGRADPDCLAFLANESAPGVRLSDTAAYREGQFVVMDEASSLAVRFAGPAAGERVLDACAAPGGKTACLAWAAGEGGSVVAGDSASRRLVRLRENCARIRAEVEILRMDARNPPFRRQFDLVLVDAPCSGLGVLRRHPDARWRAGEGALAAQAARQAAILRGAASAVRRGGKLAYAVCSNEPEETESVASSFQEPGFVPVWDGGALPAGAQQFLGADGALRIAPETGLDGFFAMSWRKEG